MNLNLIDIDQETGEIRLLPKNDDRSVFDFESFATRKKKTNVLVQYFLEQAQERIRGDPLYGRSIEYIRDFIEKNPQWEFESSIKIEYGNILKPAIRWAGCAKRWDLYECKSCGSKHVHKIQMCNSKFCMNCARQISLKRSLKYVPAVKYLVGQGYHLYSGVVTIRNSENLSRMELENLKKNFRKLIKLNSRKSRLYGCFPGDRVRFRKKEITVQEEDIPVLGIDGYIMNLEITRNQSDKTWHPHIHFLWFSRDGLGQDIVPYHLSKHFGAWERQGGNIAEYENQNGKKIKMSAAQRKILAQWQEITSVENEIISVYEIDTSDTGGLIRAITETVKYLPKLDYSTGEEENRGEKLTPIDIFEMFWVTKGIRTFGTSKLLWDAVKAVGTDGIDENSSQIQASEKEVFQCLVCGSLEYKEVEYAWECVERLARGQNIFFGGVS